jgi:hypothetical protein
MMDVDDIGPLGFDECPHGQRRRGVPVGFEPRGPRVVPMDGDHAHTAVVGHA